MVEGINLEMLGVPRRDAAAVEGLALISAMLPVAPIPEIVGCKAGQDGCAAQRPTAGLAALIDTLREEWRRRQSWHRAEMSLTLQAKAACRRLIPSGSLTEAETLYRATQGVGNHPRAGHTLIDVLPLVEARKVVEAHRKESERTLLALARQLPVAPFVEATRGAGLLSLAGIVGEAGDLASYGPRRGSGSGWGPPSSEVRGSGARVVSMLGRTVTA